MMECCSKDPFCQEREEEEIRRETIDGREGAETKGSTTQSCETFFMQCAAFMIAMAKQNAISRAAELEQVQSFV